MSLFVGGKLKFKKPNVNSATLALKEKIIEVNYKNKREMEILNDVKDSITNYCIVPGNTNNNNISSIMNSESYNTSNNNNNKDDKNYISDNNYVYKKELNLKEKDCRTLAEKKFDELRLKKLPIKVNKEVKENRKDIINKFNKMLDKQADHYDIPKVGTGNM
jgi:hypothetical protein